MTRTYYNGEAALKSLSRKDILRGVETPSSELLVLPVDIEDYSDYRNNSYKIRISGVTAFGTKVCILVGGIIPLRNDPLASVAKNTAPLPGSGRGALLFRGGLGRRPCGSLARCGSASLHIDVIDTKRPQSVEDRADHCGGSTGSAASPAPLMPSGLVVAGTSSVPTPSRESRRRAASRNLEVAGDELAVGVEHDLIPISAWPTPCATPPWI